MMEPQTSGRLVLIAYLVSSACSRPSGGAPAPLDLAVSPTASAGGAAADGSASSASDGTTGAVRARIQAWNRALDAHSVESIEPFYAERVCFYGRVVSRAKVLGAKKAALGPKSSFHQEIVGDVVVRVQGDGAVAARFVKRSGPTDRLRDTPAKVVLSGLGTPEGLAIVEEADDVVRADAEGPDPCETEALQAAQDVACEGAVNEVVNALPLVKAFLLDAKGAVEAGAVLGSNGPQEDGDGKMTWAMGFDSPERFEPHVVYTFDRKTSALTVLVDGQDEAVPKQALGAVVAACRR